MSSERSKLGSFLKEVINWNWKEFCEAEKDPKYTGLQATVLALVRTTSEGKLGAIKLAIERVDGKLETPINIEYPKVYYVYPEAEKLAAPIGEAAKIESGEKLPAIIDHIEEESEKEPINAATMSLRQTLNKMADSPRQVVQLILHRKTQVEQQLRAGEEVKDGEDAALKIPLVKSIIAANLLNLAEKNNFEAIMEIFDQIDGKLVETIRIIGDDLYLPQYALEAPYGAVKNEDGLYMIEATEVTQRWRQKLESNRS